MCSRHPAVRNAEPYCASVLRFAPPTPLSHPFFTALVCPVHRVRTGTYKYANGYMTYEGDWVNGIKHGELRGSAMGGPSCMQPHGAAIIDVPLMTKCCWAWAHGGGCRPLKSSQPQPRCAASCLHRPGRADLQGWRLL